MRVRVHATAASRKRSHLHGRRIRCLIKGPWALARSSARPRSVAGDAPSPSCPTVNASIVNTPPCPPLSRPRLHFLHHPDVGKTEDTEGGRLERLEESTQGASEVWPACDHIVVGAEGDRRCE